MLQDLMSFFQELEEDTPVVPKVTYEDIIDYFVVYQKKDANKTAVRGAVLKQKHQNGILIYQFYMDAADKIVSGRQFVTLELNQELSEAFGDKDLLIVQ
jgi:hypothetical protein